VLCRRNLQDAVISASVVADITAADLPGTRLTPEIAYGYENPMEMSGVIP